MGKSVRKPSGFGLQAGPVIPLNLLGDSDSSPAPKMERGLQAGFWYQGPRRGCWAMGGT